MTSCYWTPPARCSQFTRHANGIITVDEWYRFALFGGGFLDCVTNDNLYGVIWEHSQNTVTITVANGRAVYQLTKPDCNGNWPGILIEAALDMPEAEP